MRFGGGDFKEKLLRSSMRDSNFKTFSKCLCNEEILMLNLYSTEAVNFCLKDDSDFSQDLYIVLDNSVILKSQSILSCLKMIWALLVLLKREVGGGLYYPIFIFLKIKHKRSHFWTALFSPMVR